MKLTRFCGSLRDHETHEWGTPRREWVGELYQRVTYVCTGPPVVEGGSCYRNHNRSEQ